MCCRCRHRFRSSIPSSPSSGEVTTINSDFLSDTLDSSFRLETSTREEQQASFDQHEYEEQERELTAVDSETVPTYWTNKKGPGYIKFSQMVYASPEDNVQFRTLFDETCRAVHSSDRPCPKTDPVECPEASCGCPCNQPGRNPGVCMQYFIRRVIRVEDSSLWARYVEKRSSVCKRCLVDRGVSSRVLMSSTIEKSPEVFAPLNPTEVYLWHGTSVRTALDIARSGFDRSRPSSKQPRDYGQGVYLAESCTHADEQAKDEPGGFYEGIFACLLCRVCLGRMLFTQDRVDVSLARRMLDGEWDSVCADDQTGDDPLRDFVVYNPDQCYVEYVVLYSRKHSLFDVPFFTELPVYWRNVARDPGKEPFRKKYVVCQKTYDMLRSLVAATSEKEPPKLCKVWRVENSGTWNKYTAFKEALRMRLEGKAVKSVTSADVLDQSFGHVIVDVVLRKLAEVDLEEEVSFENIEHSLGEHLLWHGTSKKAARGIARNNFQMPAFRGGANGARFGHGIYLAENFDKAFSYAPDESGKRYVLLCRFCAGEMHYVNTSLQPLAHLRAKELGKDSVLAHPHNNGVREFVALGAEQIYPEFIFKFDVSKRPSLPGAVKESSGDLEESPSLVSTRAADFEPEDCANIEIVD